MFAASSARDVLLQIASILSFLPLREKAQVCMRTRGGKLHTPLQQQRGVNTPTTLSETGSRLSFSLFHSSPFSKGRTQNARTCQEHKT